ncbi:type IA DNA topoisomerase [Bifidobacterium cuniculi]|uniref:DNA topoisomerase n=1 Tax=Bifidobacterium cuniculi TaxID=1688 RepID=A0A087AVV4_9BIFI|nr:type IA DNA topoisomerase [Bifidobacterium cuniculi]KFI62904.1 DNA topoisomerase [Bifidobacterium cuniculi]
MTKVVIAEKRSVARAVAAALGGGVERAGGIECGDVVVTWAAGHLVDLAEPGDYPGRGWGRWSMESLPIDPGEWRWRVEGGEARARLDAIRAAVGRDGVDVLVNACDPDREGEAIFDRIVRYLGVRLPVLRLWVASLEEDAIRAAWETMRPGVEYRGLRDAADIRAKADWLIGMNASRAYGLVHDARVSVGRVQTPTLAMVVGRDGEVESHRPVPFWQAVAPMGGFTFMSGREQDQARARLAADLAARGLAVTKVERREVHDRPPRLYDLTGLQKDMNRMHRMSAARTLAALQGLYEAGLATYPRTDSRFITHDDLPTLEALLACAPLADVYAPAARGMRMRPELTVSDGRVAGHTAILPTARAAHADPARLDEDGRLVLTRVVRRMFEAVGDDRVRMLVHAHARAGHGTDVFGFDASSDETLQAGWSVVEPPRADTDADTDTDGDDARRVARERIPANLREGVTLAPVGPTGVHEGRTSPPKRFTEATLLAAMEHASRFVDDPGLKAALDDDTSHSGGIGTPATRADVIEKLLRCGYLERRRGGALVSTQAGRDLVRVVDARLRDVALTADMEQALAQVERGGADPAEVMEAFRAWAVEIPSLAAESRDVGVTLARQWGPCPRCGAPVVERGGVWTCSTNRSERDGDGSWRDVEGCGWRLWPTLCGVRLTDANVRRLLAGGQVARKGFTSKRTGRRFDAKVAIDARRGARLVFDDEPRARGGAHAPGANRTQTPEGEE